MVIQNPDRRVRSEDPECNVDSLVWLLVTDMAVRGVPLALGRFRIPVIQGLDDQEDEFANNGRLNETGRLQVEEDEIMSAGPSSRETRQWREVAAMQRRFHVLRSSALNADEGDIDYQPGEQLEVPRAPYDYPSKSARLSRCDSAIGSGTC